MRREARVLELRLFVFILVIVVAAFLLLLVIVATILIAATIIILARLLQCIFRDFSCHTTGGRRNLSVVGGACACRAVGLVGHGLGVRLRSCRRIVGFCVAGLWRAFGHVDSDDRGTFMAFRRRGSVAMESSPLGGQGVSRCQCQATSGVDRGCGSGSFGRKAKRYVRPS